jgi:hypothetical protein
VRDTSSVFLKVHLKVTGTRVNCIFIIIPLTSKIKFQKANVDLAQKSKL